MAHGLCGNQCDKMRGCENIKFVFFFLPVPDILKGKLAQRHRSVADVLKQIRFKLNSEHNQ